MLENRLEQVNGVIDSAQEKIDLLNYEPSKKRKLLFYFFPLIITLFGAGISFTFSFFYDLFNAFINSFVASTIWAGATSLGYEFGIKKF